MKFKYVILSLLPLCGLVSCNNKIGGGIEFDFNIIERSEGNKKLSFILAPSSEILSPKGDYRVNVIWGDGKSDTLSKEDFIEDFTFLCSHDYKEAKNYRVKIVGSVSGISFSKVEKNQDQKITGYPTLFSDDNIYVDNFVINSFNQLRNVSDYSDIVLGGKSTTGQISKMSNVTFNYSISNFSGFTFDNTSLKTVTLPDSLIRITDSDFAELSTLETVNLSNDSKLTVIDDGAFFGCTSLKSFVVPSYVYRLDDDVFCGCESLETVKFISTTPVIISGETFDITCLPKKIIVPKGCKDSYIEEWTDTVPPEVILKIVEE